MASWFVNPKHKQIWLPPARLAIVSLAAVIAAGDHAGAAITAAKLAMARRAGGNQICLCFRLTNQDLMQVPWNRLRDENS